MRIHVVNRGGSLTTETLRHGEEKFLTETYREKKNQFSVTLCLRGERTWNAIMLEGESD
jgi:hypothetical protein